MKKNLKGLILLAVCACLCVGYYFYLNYCEEAKDQLPTEIDEVMAKDLDKSYPSTPREVIKFYNRILSCIYDGESTQDEIEALSQQARKLYDEELLAENPENTQIGNLKEELEEYAEDNKKIANVTISTSQDVERREIDGEKYAYVESSYYIKGNDTSGRVGQTYILRKDDQGQWKILGYYKP